MGKRKAVKKDSGDLSKDLENWMTNLPQKLKEIPLIYLAIPGSHDSFTSNITTKSDISPDAEDIIKTLSFLGPVLKHFMVNWSRTQTYMAADQLIRGVRYFDLRIATKEGTEDLYFVHGLYSDMVQTAFDEIVAFLETHPQEVVILDCQHFYAFTQSDHERLMQMFNKTFGAKLLPYTDHMDYITLGYMTTQYRYQVIAVYRSDAARFGQPLLWPSDSFPNPWPDTIDATTLFTALDKGLQNRSSSLGYITQCLLTPTPWFIFKNICSTLQEKCAMALEKSKLEWIAQQTPGEGGLNVIISDYIDLSDCQYVKDVIDLNEKLISNSTKIAEMTTISTINEVKK